MNTIAENIAYGNPDVTMEEITEAARIANGGKLFFGSDKSPELKKQSDRAHKLLHKLEADYEKEDEAMLIRLIKIRNSLWT